MPEQLYSENYRINPIPFDASDDRIQFYCSFLSTWKPGFTGKSAGGTHAVYSLVLQGKYHLYYKERKYTIPEAHFTINRIPHPYTKAVTAGQFPLVRKSCMLYRNAFHDMISSRLFPDAHTPLPLRNPEKVEKLMDSIHEHLGDTGSVDETALAGLFFQLLHELRAQQKKNQLPDSLNRALEFIARNLYDPGLSRERIAVHCGVSVRTLSRLFHSELDTQPAQYILRLRLEQVRNMLALPRLSIKEIAEQCGFRSAGFLARQFRRHCRMTPRAYRDTVCRLP